MNIYNYVENIKKDEINDVNALDALIFTRLSYLHLEIIKDKFPISILELKGYLDEIKAKSHDKKLVELLAKCLCFNSIKIIRCHDIFSKENEEQFFAVTFQLPNNTLFVSFRGTNKNLYGFKEDLNMSYKIIPSCIDGVKYLESEKLCDKIYLGGHSKGGHIAMYAGCHTTYFRRLRIKKIFNFDGPGFLDFNDTFLNMRKKIINYFPECSIVGRLMENKLDIIAVKTLKDGIEGHNLYNWMIDENDLMVGSLNKKSDDFHDICNKLLKTIPIEKRKDVIDYIFDLMIKGEIKDLSSLNINEVKNFISKIPQLGKEEKNILVEFFKELIKISLPTIIKVSKQA